LFFSFLSRDKVAPDEITYKYLRGRPMSPPEKFFDSAVEYWRTLSSDADSQYDKEVNSSLFIARGD
jgi:3-isopropylmalate dehydratase